MSDENGTILPPITLPLPRPPVADLRDKDPGLVLIVDNTGSKCWQHAVVVHEANRTVTCKTCGAKLDAFDTLLDVARKHVRLEDSWKHYRAEVFAAEKRLEYLKRLETNTKARLKRFEVEIPPKHELDAHLDARLYGWTSQGKVYVGAARGKPFSPDEARTAAGVLMRLAGEAEKAAKSG